MNKKRLSIPIWFYLLSMIAIVLLGIFVYFSLINNEIKFESTAISFDVYYTYPLETRNLPTLSKICEDEFSKQIINGIYKNCYVESFSWENVKYYNGDNIESYADEDYFTNIKINCFCTYKI
jgi:hypothetical protein